MTHYQVSRPLLLLVLLCGLCAGEHLESSSVLDTGQPFRVESASTDFKGRIAVSADGNHHDSDDWGATALSLAILAKAGLQSKLVHYDYNNHIWESTPGWPAQQQESTLGGAQRFGFDAGAFFDDLTQLSAAVAHITQVINASSADDPLTFVLAGPMEVAYWGFWHAEPSKRQYVRCISHSGWNDEHAVEHGGRSFNDIIALGCVNNHIQDQNPGLGWQSMGNWAWLNAGDANLQWVYGRIDAVEQDGDASDAGMVRYAHSGDQFATAATLQVFFSQAPVPNIGPPRNLRVVATGQNAMITWTPPNVGLAQQYLLEAGSVPGESNLGGYYTPVPGLFAPGAPIGTYYLRVRSVSSGGISAASNEVAAVVKGNCTAPPPTPTDVRVTVAGAQVTLQWGLPTTSNGPTVFSIDVGTGPGLSNLLVHPVDYTQRSLTTVGPPGTYYIRMRSHNACGSSGSSNEIMLVL